MGRASARRSLWFFAGSVALSLGCEFVGGNDSPPAAEKIEPKRYNVVPLPRTLVERSGTLELGEATSIAERRSDPELERVTQGLAARLRAATGYAIPVAADPMAPPATVELTLDPAVADEEGYVLDVTTTRIAISAKTGRGLFYGVQTLRQLLPADIDAPSASAGALTLPAVRIEDAPRFRYRGMHLDVSRHFFPVDFVERYIDLLSLYKMNVFHWHLTDDQGWRIEIKKYPKLTEIGSQRKQTVVGYPGPNTTYDGTPYGGFYTQDQIREVVAYAAARYVDVLPEIEMPGHCLAALASHPELACTAGPFETATTWGVFEDVMCPSDTTFQFLDDVLAEVASLFPNPLVHVGGDEVPLDRWNASSVAQDAVAKAGLASTADLEAYFIRTVGASLQAMGKSFVAWDEAAAGAKIPGLTVMSWRDADTGSDAARRGYQVIMTPTTSCYFDRPEATSTDDLPSAGGVLPLDGVYAFDPLPAGLTPEQTALVLGAQGNVWTEYIASPSRAEFMAFPRALALAEAVWSPQASRTYPDFLARLTGNAKHLDALGVNYAHYFERR
jgi:hexosaminidase